MEINGVRGVGGEDGSRKAAQSRGAQKDLAARLREKEQTLSRLKKDDKASAKPSKEGTAVKASSKSSGGQVGELARELAAARTKFDVQRVSGKVSQALSSLKLSLAAAEGKEEKQKLRRLIKRMEKLMKNTRVKLKHLDKEEQLERRRQKLEAQEQRKQAQEVDKELKNRRKRRTREEQNYAMKELARDGEAGSEGAAAFAASGAFPAGASVPTAAPAPAGPDAAAPAADGAALDVSA